MGDRKQQANGAQQAFDQGTEKERKLSGLGPHDGAKGERERSGRKARTSSRPALGRSLWCPLRVAFLAREEPFAMLSSAPRPVLSRAGRALPASPPIVRGLCVAAGGLHPQVPSVLGEEGSCTAVRSHPLRPLSTFTP